MPQTSLLTVSGRESLEKPSALSEKFGLILTEAARNKSRRGRGMDGGAEKERENMYELGFSGVRPVEYYSSSSAGSRAGTLLSGLARVGRQDFG